MQSSELIELAGVVAMHGPVLLASGGRVSSSALENYWASFALPAGSLSRALRQFQSTSLGPDDPQPWPALRGTLEEIIVSEALTRVWSAVLTQYDREHDSRDAEPVARSVMMGHLEARHRLLALLVSAAGIPTEAAVAINRLRHRVERWTDLLLARLAGTCDVRDFAFDHERITDFAADLNRQTHQPAVRQVWTLTMTGLRRAFAEGMAESPNGELNGQIAANVLACFPAEMFDGVGVVRSLWLTRIANATDDAQGMVDALLENNDAAADRLASDAGVRWPRDFRSRFPRGSTGPT